MPLFEWSDERFGISVPAIDSQHRRLMELANRMEAAQLTRRDDSMLDTLLGELIDYTEYHFAVEEELMSSSSYPDLARHQKLHEELTAQVAELASDVVKSSQQIAGEVQQLLGQWLTIHIEVQDRAFGRYLQARTPA